jgi:Leucine-rich repeat (LRR) protein
MDAEEISRLFEQELLELDTFDDELEEDEDFSALAELKAQLKRNLDRDDDHGQDKDDQEMADLMQSNSRKRFEAIEDAVSWTQHSNNKRTDGTVDDIESSKEEKQNYDSTSKVTEQSSVSTSLKKDLEIQIDPQIVALLDSMVAGIEKVSSLSAPTQKEAAREVKADLSGLPDMITDENEAKDNTVVEGTDYIEIGYKHPNAGKDETSVDPEQQRIQEALELLKEVERKLDEETEQEQKQLEEGRRQREEKKKVMLEDMMRAKRGKASEKISMLLKGYVARVRFGKMKLEVVVAAEKARKEKEAALEVAEGEMMQDEDLEMMSFLQSERRTHEREWAYMSTEDEFSALYKEYLRVSALSEEQKQDEENRKEIAALMDEEWIPQVEIMRRRQIEEDLAMRRLRAEHQKAAWKHFNTVKERRSAPLGTSASTACLKDDDSQKWKDAVSCWSFYSKLHPLDWDYDEWGVWRWDKPDKDEWDVAVEEDEVFRVYDDQPEEVDADEGEEVEYDGFEEDGEEEGKKDGKRRKKRPDRRHHHTGLKDLYAESTSVVNEYLLNYWSHLVRTAIANSVISLRFREDGISMATSMLQKHVPVAFVTQPGQRKASEGGSNVPMSPRAKIGMRVMTSRASVGSGSGPEGDDAGVDNVALIPSDPVDRRLLLLDPSHTQPMEKLEKPVTTSSTLCPLSRALNQWHQLWVERAESMPAYGDTTSTTGLSLDAGEDLLFEEDTEAADADIRNRLGLRAEESKRILNLELNVEELPTASFLKPFTCLKRLHLNVNSLKHLDGLQALTSLVELSIKDNGLVSIAPLVALYSLKILHVDNNNLTDIEAVASMNQLEHLSANTNSITRVPELKGCMRLRRLELYHNNISEVHMAAFRGLTDLTHLDLGRNCLSYIDGSTLNECNSLQTLILSQNRLEVVPSPLMLPFLQVLWLSGNKLRDLQSWTVLPPGELSMEGLRPDTLVWPVFLPSMETLHLQDNELKEVSDTALLAVPRLTFVDLSFNNLRSVDGIKSLGTAPLLAHVLLQDNPLASMNTASARSKDNYLSWILRNCRHIATISNERREVVISQLREAGMWADEGANSDDFEQSTAQHIYCQQRSTSGQWYGTTESEWQTVQMHSSIVRALFRRMRPLEPPSELMVAQAVCAGEMKVRYNSTLLQLLHTLEVEQRVNEVERKALSKEITAQRVEDAAGYYYNAATEKEELAAQLTTTLHSQVMTLKAYSTCNIPQQQLIHFDHRNGRKRKKRKNQLKRDSYVGKNQHQIRHLASIKVQAIMRGYLGRARLRRVLVETQYTDDDLDLIFTEDHDEPDIDMEELLDAPELHDHYFNPHRKVPSTMEDAPTQIEQAREKGQETVSILPVGPSDTMVEQSTLQMSQERPLVYGDHRRARQTSGVEDAFQGTVNLQPSAWSGAEFAQHRPVSAMTDSSFVSEAEEEAPGGPSGTMDMDSPFIQNTMERMQGEAFSPYSDMSAPHRAGPAGSRMPPLQTKDTIKIRGIAGGNSQYSAGNNQKPVGPDPAAERMAQEWGINDPKVLAMMMKRTKKLSTLSTPNSGTAASGRSASGLARTGGGGFGGRNKTFKPSTKTKNSAKKQRPAWLNPMTGKEDNS